jgi:hypothetical protein
MVFVWTPVFVIFNVLELKLVEEPELERGAYRCSFPRVPGVSNSKKRVV